MLPPEIIRSLDPRGSVMAQDAVDAGPQPLSANTAFLRGGPDRLRILVVAAAPLGESEQLDLGREWRLMRHAIRAATLPVTLFRLMPSTAAKLEEALVACHEAAIAPQVVHFSGHGNPRSLVFEDAWGAPSVVTRERLVEILLGRRVRLLFLNACHSATHETFSLARFCIEQGSVNAAIGHRHPISDEAAIAFSNSLYRGLCAGAPIGDAFARARADLAIVNPEAAAATEFCGDKDLVLADATTGQPAPPLVFDGMPRRIRIPEVQHFFGRVEELREAGRGIASPAVRNLVINGIGGIGKTTFALELAHRHAWRFEGGIAMASAHDAPYAPKAEQLFRNLVSMLAVSPGTESTAVESLLATCRERPALLLFDGLEAMPSSELDIVAEALFALPRNGTKALITVHSLQARLRSLPDAMMLHMHGLTESAATAYVLQLGAIHHVRELITGEATQAEQFARFLASTLHGHPSMLELAVGRLGRSGRDALRLELSELLSGGDQGSGTGTVLAAQLTRLMAPSLRTLDAPGRTVASLLGVLPVLTFTFDELTTMASLLAADQQKVEYLRAGIDACLRACLITDDIENELYGINRMVHVMIQQMLPLEPTMAREAINRLFNATLEFCLEHRDDVPALERRAPLFQVLFEYTWSTGDAEVRRRVAEAAKGLLYFYSVTGRRFELNQWLDRLGGGVHVRTAVSLHRASSLVNEGQASQARNLLLGHLETHGKDEEEAATLLQLAELEIHQDRYEKAAEYLTRARSSVDRKANPALSAKEKYVSGCLAKQTGDRQVARALLEEARLAFHVIEHHSGVAVCQIELAEILIDSRELHTARLLLEDARLMLKKAAERTHLSSVLEKLATIATLEGDLIEAKSILREALKLNKELGDVSGTANVLNELSRIEHKRGHYEQSLTLARRAVDLRRATGEWVECAKSLCNLASALLSLRRYSEARLTATEALGLAERVGDARSIALSAHTIGVIDHAMGRIDAAAVFYAQSIKFLQGTRSERDLTDVYTALALIELERHNLAGARSLLEKAVEIAERYRHLVAIADALSQLGKVDVASGDLVSAKAHITRALRVAEEIGSHHRRGRILMELGDVLLALGETEAGRELLQEGALVLEEIGVSAAAARAVLRHARPDGMIDLDEIIQAAHGMLHGGEERRAREILEPLIPLINPVEHRVHLATARTIVAAALFLEERFPDALEEVEKALPLTEGPEDELLREELLGLRGALQKELQICEMAGVSVESLRKQAADPAEFADLLATKALGHVILRQFGEAERCLAEAEVEAAQCTDPTAIARTLNTRVYLYIERGEIEAATKTILELRQLLEAHLPGQMPVVDALETRLRRKIARS